MKPREGLIHADGRKLTPDLVDDADGAVLIYDGECPFCSAYVRLVRLRAALGILRLVDARVGGREVEEIREAGLDIDEGMVLKLGDRYYHGDDCIHLLAILSSPSDGFNRFNGWVFKSKTRACVLYPILRSCRNLVLALLGRRKIRLASGQHD